MTPAIVLATIALVQAAFLLLLVVFLVVRRAYDRRQRAAFLAARGDVAAPMRAWLVAGAHPAPVVAALRALPRGTAIGYASLLARQTIPGASRDELADALRDEPWVASAIAQRHSRFWWRRLEAARALSLVARDRERAAVASLLGDSHPAVLIAAASALPRVADAALVGSLLDRLPRLPKVVRSFLTAVLAECRHLVGPELAARITAGGELAQLAAWIELADVVDVPAAVSAALARAGHPAAAVRRGVARVLRRRPGSATLQVLAGLLGDTDASVRAAAARSIGELGGDAGVDVLMPLLGDRVWNVRLHAALALAQTGERGRAVLRSARAGPDRFAREMAAMVSGLSTGAILELADG